MRTHSYFVYILTNASRKVLYTGITNHLGRRIEEHRKDALGTKKSFAGTYNCFYLVYWEYFQYVDQAIAREKEIKGWRRAKKDALIEDFNPQWKFLNDEVGYSFN
ncbi:MAG: GIY-YIG nuclease family protein [Bacteroidota bacterium]